MQDDTRLQVPKFPQVDVDRKPPEPPDGWKIAAVAAGGVAAVTGVPIIATAAIVGGVVWAIESSRKE